MAWETRKGRGSYYTRSKRVNGRVERQYFGTGPAGEMAATADALRRFEKQTEAQTRREQQRRHDELTAPPDRLCRLTDLLLKATLLSEGYHQHDRGAWRRRRHADTPADLPAGQELPARAEGDPGPGDAGRPDRAA